MARTLLAALFAAGAGGCGGSPPELEQGFTVMGTAISVRVAPDNRDQLPLAYQAAKDIMNRMSALTNEQDPDSEISQINRSAGTSRVPVSRDLYQLLNLALDYTDKTQGMVDITTASLAQLWGFLGSPVPDDPVAGEISRAALGAIGRRHVRLLEQGSIEFTSPYTRIGLQGLSLGYAVDLSIVQLRRSRIGPLLINLGGTGIRCLGQPGRKTRWSIPLLNPFFIEEEIGQVRLDDGQGLATTRLYDNYVTIKGKRYSSILDPRTGQPAAGTASVSVIAPTAFEANVLSIALMVSSPEETIRLLQHFPRCQALLIPDRQPLELRLTRGFSSALSLRPEVQSALQWIDLPDPQQ